MKKQTLKETIETMKSLYKEYKNESKLFFETGEDEHNENCMEAFDKLEKLVAKMTNRKQGPTTTRIIFSDEFKAMMMA